MTTTTSGTVQMNQIRKSHTATTEVVQALRDAVVATVNDGQLHDGINTAVLTLATAEGAASYWAKMLYVAKIVTDREGDVTAALQDSTLRLLTGGANDDWSGRGNDAKRAYFDGVRAAAASFTN